MACTRCGTKVANTGKPTQQPSQPIAQTPNDANRQERSGWKPR